MSRFLYYFPGAKSQSDVEGVIEGAGLDGVIEPGNRLYGSSTGPDGLGGMIMVNGGDPSPRYLEDLQRWHECADGAFWVGYTTESPPGPADLARPELVDGHLVRLEDGQDWLVPVVRAFMGGTHLPERVSLSASGEVETRLLPSYVDLSRRLEAVFDMVQESDGRITFETTQEPFDLASDGLGVNYFAGRWELSALGIFTTVNLIDVLEALLDVPTYEKVAEFMGDKKKRENPVTGRSNSSDGGEAS